MQLKYGAKLYLPLFFICLLASTAFCASSYDRELIVQDKTRAMQVESVFKEMMAAYEDEDARGFLDYVSDERFRQDYITFTDALYNDFRNYEIHQVDYWIDKVVPDNVKQFLFVHWEKRYENLDDGRQLTQKGVSRFLFDEVEGEYLLVELAGNNLFGASLQEWTQEVPQISGQEVTAQEQDSSQGQPDLRVISGSQTYVSPDEVLTFVVENSGAATSAPCTLEARTLHPSPMGYTYLIPSLNPGETYTSPEILNIPTVEYLIVDMNDVVAESNETNNTYTMPGLP